LPVGTHRLGIVLLSDNILSEQKLDSVALTYPYGMAGCAGGIAGPDPRTSGKSF